MRKLFLYFVLFFQLMFDSDAKVCSELGPSLENLSRMPFFSHIDVDPECIENVSPKVKLYASKYRPKVLCDVQFTRKKSFKKGVKECDFHGLKKLKILTHGFTGSETDTLYLKDEILKTEKDAGVLTLDWSAGADFTFSWRDARTILTKGVHSWIKSFSAYQQAASNTRYAGAALANILKEVHHLYPGLSLHCIGHSLGAHVCGFAGKALKRISSTKMDRISALDPAGPLFLPNKIVPDFKDTAIARLDTLDAKFVDVIHTDGDCLGSFKTIGHVDIYPGSYKGYGCNQPGSKNFGESHSRSKAIYRATISEKCVTTSSCTVSSDVGCEADMMRFNSQSIGYKQQNMNARGVFLINTTETSLDCMDGNAVEFGQFKIPGKLGLGNCLELGGLLRAIIKMDYAEIFAELTSFLTGHFKKLLLNVNEFFDHDIFKQLGNVRRAIENAEETYYMLKIKKIEMRAMFDKTLRHVEHESKDIKEIMHRLADRTVQLINDIFARNNGHQEYFDKLKDLSHDAVNIIRDVKGRMNEIENMIKDLEDEFEKKNTEVDIIVATVISKLEEQEANINGYWGDSIRASIEMLFCGGSALNFFNPECRIKNAGKLRVLIINGLILKHIDLPALKNAKQNIENEQRNIKKQKEEIEGKIRHFTKLLDNEEEAISDWENEANSLNLLLKRWTGTFKITDRLKTVLTRMKFEAQEYLEVSRCDKIKEVHQEKNILKVSIMDGSANILTRKAIEQRKTYKEKEEINLVCDTGCADSVDWYRVAKITGRKRYLIHMPKESSEKMFIGDRYLWIHSAKKKHEGRYMCKAKKARNTADSQLVKIKVDTECVDKTLFKGMPVDCGQVVSLGLCQGYWSKVCCYSCSK